MRKNNGKLIACEICGKMKYFDGYQVKRNKHFYCSKDCFGHGHSKSKVKLTKEFLIEEYVNKQKPMMRIAKEVKCDKRTISNRLKQYNIEIRSKENCRKIVHCDICGKELWKYEYDLKKFKHFFCSNECYKKHRSLFNPTKREDVKIKMRISAKKRENQSNYIDGRCLKQYFCKICNRPINFHTALYGEGYCKWCSHAGKRNPNFGKTILIKFCSYKNKWFKSAWEANFAKWCDGSGIKWEYEPKAFQLKIDNKMTHYTPDFYLPEFNLLIEIKGYWRKDAQEKVNAFKKLFPDNKLEIFEKKRLQELGVI